MTSADDILNQIDAALGDPFVSPDAMRCKPEGAELRVWIESVDAAPRFRAERESVDGITSVEIRDALSAMAAAAMTPGMENAARALQQLAEAARAAAASSPDDFALAPPQPSRPADWTPCGPKPRRGP